MNLKNGRLARLLQLIAHCKLSLAGVTLFALVFPLLFFSTIIDLQGGIENPYFSLLIYLLLGPLVLIALGMILIGALLTDCEKEQPLFTYERLKEQLTIPGHYRRIRRRTYGATVLALFFLFLLGIAAHSGHRYTESVSFCGNFCHVAMVPELVTHLTSPHSRIRCVDCHISRDADGLTAAKLIGMKQLYATMLGTYPRPLQTPVENLRPSRQTCEECHRPEKFHGHRLYFLDTFLPDEHNTHLQTAMILKVGSGGYLGRSAHGIHWHTSEQQRIFYLAEDRARQEINSMTLFDAAGMATTYHREGVEPSLHSEAVERLMDCIDCHNRPTHVFLPPEAALDQKLLTRQIPTELPYIKRQALEAITREYESALEARVGIALELRHWYELNYPGLAAVRPELLEQAIRGTQQAYAENVFPEMKIFWNTYPNFIGHHLDGGCFRCHDDSFHSPEGRTISRDCNLCHIILAERQPADRVLEIISRTRTEPQAADSP